MFFFYTHKIQKLIHEYKTKKLRGLPNVKIYQDLHLILSDTIEVGEGLVDFYTILNKQEQCNDEIRPGK